MCAAYPIESRAIFEPWSVYRRQAVLMGESPMRQHMAYPTVNGASFGGNLLVIEQGRETESFQTTADQVFLVVEGEADFNVDGRWYPLVKLDLISIPAKHAYHILNGGLGAATLCKIAAQDADIDRMPDERVEHWRWQEYRRDFRWTLPLAETPGYVRGSGPLLRPAQLRGHTVRLPAHQTSPWHYAARDLLFLVIVGEIEFECGGRVYPMEKLDFLLIPAQMPYKYTNFGLTEELHLSIGGILEPGRKGVYFHDDPGWPIRPDARTMQVEIDIYGDAKASN